MLRRLTTIALLVFATPALAIDLSDIPPKITVPWGTSAPGPNITYPIPTASQIPVTPGRASYTDGFPPVTFLPPGAGGVPPFGQDFNGVFKQVTAWLRWHQAGGQVAYDATFQSGVGGYPAGAVVASATLPGIYWRNLANGNATNPDSGGTNWAGFAVANATSNGINWGGFQPYSATLQTALGGYPAGAYVASTTNQGVYWRSTASNNVTNPDSGGAGWQGFSLPQNHGSQYIVGSSGNFTVPSGVFSVSFEFWGPGGGGAGTPGGALDTGSGGSGAWCQATLPVVPGQLLAYVLPGGGPGGNTGNNDGTAGATASITVGSTAYTAGGGGGGVHGSQTNGSGGSPGGNCQGRMFGQTGEANIHVSTTLVGGTGGSAPRGGVGGRSSGGGGADPGGGGAAGANPSTGAGGGNGGASGALFTW